MFPVRALRAAVAAALFLCLAGAASAQTVIVRKAPPGSAVEVTVNGAPGGAGTVNEAGDAVVKVNVLGAGGRTETDAFLFVELCDAVRRVVIVEQTAQTPPPAEGCRRHEVPGLFVLRPESSLVFDVSGSQPTVLLRQGSYSLKPPRVWKPAPTGFVVFGAAGLGKIRSASAIGCGLVEGCQSDDSGVALTAGAAYWLTPWLAGEVTYLRPAETTATAEIGDVSFTHTVDAELVNIAAKVGVPLGPTRAYGSIGTVWHRALTKTVQTSGSITDTIELQTEGWNWSWGGGFEIWLASSFAIYTEGGSMAIKGEAVNVEEGIIDDRLNFLVAGVRIRLGRR
jgi:hypothetical protein